MIKSIFVRRIYYLYDGSKKNKIYGFYTSRNKAIRAAHSIRVANPFAKVYLVTNYRNRPLNYVPYRKRLRKKFFGFVSR